MNTISIWYDEKTKEESREEYIDLDLHINFWKIWKKRQLVKDFKFFLDIGLKIKKYGNIKKIKIFFPFKIKKQDIKDLGTVICKKPDLVNAIFNEEYDVKIISNTKFSNLEHMEEEKDFSIYSIDVESDLEIEDKYNGSIAVITPQNSLPKKTKDVCYYRFRIDSVLLQQFTHLFTPKYSFLKSAFSQTEVIDFRVNEKRNLDKSLLEEINNANSFRINKIHFLLLRNAEDNFVYAHKNTSSCRVVEKNIWDEYIGFKHKERKIVAYHWKEKRDIDSFNAFVKIDFKKNNFKTILKYFIAIMILSITFNIASDYIYDFLKKDGRSEANKGTIKRID